MNKNYTVYHLHSDLSNGVTNIDSVTKYEQYIDYAHDLGMTAMAFSEHGSVFQWLKKKNHIEELGMKYIHAEEFYVTEKLLLEPDEIPDDLITDEMCEALSQEEIKEIIDAYIEDNTKKIRDNYHVILIAKNEDGVYELNKLSSIAFNRANVKVIDDNERYYYTPRITFEELTNTTNNIIITTACLGGILNKGNDELKERFIEFLSTNKSRCFLEIQHHNVPEQIKYNEYLYELSKKYNIPLIAGTDTHCLNVEHVKGRKILQQAKKIYFSDEEGWDLTFKSYDELVECYKRQNSLPEDVYLQAIENTNIMANMVNEFKMDYTYKYPHLWDDSMGTFRQKINDGIVRRGVDKFTNKQVYYDRIEYEIKTYEHNGAIDFMLLMADIIDWCNYNDIQVGYGRGSANGSVIAWLLGITEMDSIKYNLNFERFMNTERVSLSDIDTDFPPSRREDVKDYIFHKHGLYCSDIITFNTIALKGAIRDVCRAVYGKKDNDNSTNSYIKIADYICQNIETNEDQMRKEYSLVFEYVDIVNGTIVSVGSHPCGSIVSPHSLEDKIGLFTTSTSKYPISQINMKEVDSLNYVKLDLLALDTIELINDTCKLIGIPRYTPDNIDVNDVEVWNSMRDDTTQIFQWEGSTGNDYIKKLLSDKNIEKFKEIDENVDRMTLLSIGNSAIRPAGASYRDDLANGVVRKSGSKAIDDFLKPTFGYLVFQCQIIDFLHEYCGFTMGEADIVRRHFSKKQFTPDGIAMTELDTPVIENGGYMVDKNGKEKRDHYIKGFVATMKEKYNMTEDEAKKSIKAFLQVIVDASRYLFSLNHSQSYSFEGYVSGYLRYHYPLEFLTTALNINTGKEEKTMAITNYAKKINIFVKPIKFRYSNAKYMCDKSTNSIYKGMASIKFMNEEISNQLYELRNEQFDDFIDFLKVNPCNSRQTEILIKLDYFSEFGKSDKLLQIYKLYQELTKKGAYPIRKQIKKDSLVTEQFETYRKYAKSETGTMFKMVNMICILKEIWNQIPDNSISIKSIIDAQQEYLGYIDYINPELDKRYIYITDLDTKYSPKFTAYCINNGSTCVMKVKNQKRGKDNGHMTYFRQTPFGDGDILYMKSCSKEPSRKKVNDEWVEDKENMQWWLNEYQVVKMGNFH